MSFTIVRYSTCLVPPYVSVLLVIVFPLHIAINLSFKTLPHLFCPPLKGLFEMDIPAFPPTIQPVTYAGVPPYLQGLLSREAHFDTLLLFYLMVHLANQGLDLDQDQDRQYWQQLHSLLDLAQKRNDTIACTRLGFALFTVSSLEPMSGIGSNTQLMLARVNTQLGFPNNVVRGPYNKDQFAPWELFFQQVSRLYLVLQTYLSRLGDSTDSRRGVPSPFHIFSSRQMHEAEWKQLEDMLHTLA